MLIEELAIDLNVNEEIAVVSYEPDDDVKAKKQVTLTTEVIPFYLEKLEAIVKENNGHLALARVSCKQKNACIAARWMVLILVYIPQLTWADLYLAGILDYINYMAKTDLLEKYGGLRGLVNTVNTLEPIKAWLEKRPATDV